jgi:hypothetical protein
VNKKRKYSSKFVSNPSRGRLEVREKKERKNRAEQGEKQITYKIEKRSQYPGLEALGDLIRSLSL